MKIELYYIMYFFKHVKKLNLYKKNDDFFEILFN